MDNTERAPDTRLNITSEISIVNNVFLTPATTNTKYNQQRNLSTFHRNNDTTEKEGEENWKISFVNKFSNLETAEIKFVCSHHSTVDCIKFVPLNGRLE